MSAGHQGGGQGGGNSVWRRLHRRVRSSGLWSSRKGWQGPGRQPYTDAARQLHLMTCVAGSSQVVRQLSKACVPGTRTAPAALPQEYQSCLTTHRCRCRRAKQAGAAPPPTPWNTAQRHTGWRARLACPCSGPAHQQGVALLAEATSVKGARVVMHLSGCKANFLRLQGIGRPCPHAQ